MVFLTYLSLQRETAVAIITVFRLVRFSITQGTQCCKLAGSFSRALKSAGPDDAINQGIETTAGIFGSAIKRYFLKGHATA